MKKFTSLLLAFLLLAGMMAVPAMAAEDVKVYLFGEKLEFDVPAQIVNGRTMVPVRKIFESLGYTVEWDKNTKTATATGTERTIRITIGENAMYVNDEAKALDVPACIIHSRTLVPARAIAEASGYNVDWDGDTRSVFITELDPLDKNIVAQLGGFDITEAYYNCISYAVYSQYAQYEMYYGENWLNVDLGSGKTIAQTIEEETENQVELLVASAKIAKDNYGITGDSVRGYVDDDIDETIASYGDKETFDAFFASIGSTERGLRTYFEMFAIYDLLVEKNMQDGKAASISESDVELLFNMEYSGMMKVQHILVETESTAKEVISKLKNGASFDALITEYNEDPGQTAGGFYVFGDGEMVEEFETASKNLAVGEYTVQPVKTSYGYHIIKRYPLDKTSDEYQVCKQSLVEYALYDVIEKEMMNMSKTWK